MKNEHEEFAFIGVDIGGTFTDAIFYQQGELRILKTLTNSTDPSAGVMLLVKELAKGKFILTHGSTLATNAILERKGAKTAFITTQGFADILHIARQDRPALYALEPKKHSPLVPRELCYGVPERVDYMGDVLKPLDMDRTRDILLEIAKKGVTSLAVCLLFSFRNDYHEQKIKQSAEKLLDFVTISSEVLPEYREYERASTTVLNAYVSPILKKYITKLDTELRNAGAVDFKIMESGGGIIPAVEAGNLGVRTILSGPAGGVAGAFHLAKSIGIDRIITLDMGGTSTDVSLCDGCIGETREGDIDGFPIRIPMVDIITIGAGGGSIAYVDAGGVLKVGPESAGSDPGPAAFGKGTLPTVTDAHLVHGSLSPADFLGGSLKVDKEKAEQAIRKIAYALGISIAEAAFGIIRVAIAHMERAIRVVSLERGYDPSLFTLVPFGGAGPLHAPFIAEGLGIKQILIPRYPGVLSAFGMLTCEFRMDFTWTVLRTVDQVDAQFYNEVMKKLQERAAYFLQKNYFGSAIFEYSFDLRYLGQSFELNAIMGRQDCTKIPSGFQLPPPPAFNPSAIVSEFQRLHHQRYGFSRAEEKVEIVNFRLNLIGKNPVPSLAKKEISEEDSSQACIGKREIIFPGGKTVNVSVFSREKLKPGNIIMPPAVITQYDSTIILPYGWKARVDEYENLMMTITS